MATWVNGLDTTCVSVFDRATQFGDGVFETMRIVNADIPLLAQHLARLLEGCARLGIQPPNEALLYEEINTAINNVSEGVLKLIVSRGESKRGYRGDDSAPSTRILMRSDMPHYPESLVVRVCNTRLSRNSALAGIKHLNRLEQVLARREWEAPSIHEGIMCDTDGMVIEGVTSNLFVFRGGRFLTPKLAYSGVKGIMRQMVMNAMQSLAISCEEATFDLTAIREAEGLYMCNSLMGFRPVKQVVGEKTYSQNYDEYRRVNELICSFFNEKT